MSAFVLSLPEVEKEGTKSLSFPVTFGWLREALAETDVGVGAGADDDEAGRLEVVASKTGTDLLVQGRVQATLEAPCARCLGPVQHTADVRFTSLLSPLAAAAALPEELELTPEDLDRETFSGDDVVLDAIVREQLLLDLPMRLVHDEGDCDPEMLAYLARREATVTRIDPRLAPLLALKQQLGKDE